MKTIPAPRKNPASRLPRPTFPQTLKRLLFAACCLFFSAGYLTAQPAINSIYPPVLTERVGDHVAYNVTATASAGTLTYQWFVTGNPTPLSSTSNSLPLANIQTTDAGTYYVVVGDDNGTTTSGTVTLNVINSSTLTLSTGNVIVARVGEGSQPLSLTTGNTLYLDQYTPGGAYVNSIQVPDEAVGNSYGTGGSASAFGSPALLVAGAGADASYEAMLNLSTVNSQFISFAGYCQAYPFTGGNVNTATASWRGLCTVNAFGVYNLAYTNTGMYNGGTQLIRDAVTLESTNWWATGGAGSGTVKFINTTVASYKNGSGVPGSVGTAPNSFVSGAGGRVVQIIKGALVPTGFNAVSNLVYSETLATNLNGLYAAVGAPQPAGGANITFKALLYTGSATNNPAQPGDFAFSPDNKTIYVADSRPFGTTNSSLAGGIQRWDSNGTGYSYSYTIQPVTGQTNGVQGMTVDFSATATWGSNVTGAIIYATTVGAAGNTLVKIVDNGPASAPTALVTAGPNEALRGVRFSPAAIPPSVVTAPQSQTNVPGNNATFTVNVNGSAPLFYQWYYNNVAISGATTNTFTTNSIVFASAGTYSVTVSNLTTSFTSNSAVLTVTAGSPTITALTSYTETAGDHLAWAPNIVGTPPYTNYWYKNGTLIQTTVTPGSDGSLVLPNLQTTDSGTYALFVSNVFGFATRSATLTVTPGLQSLSSSNLVVVRIGDGEQPLSGATGNTLYLDQYTPAGVYVNTIQIPDEGTGQSYGTGSVSSVGTTPAFLVAGAGPDAPLEGLLTRSANGETLDFTGYCQAYPYANTDVTIAGSGGGPIWRGVGEVNAFGVYSQVYTNTGLYNGGGHQIHGVVTLDQSNYWVAGTAGSVGGLKYLSTAFQPASGNGIATVSGSLTGVRTCRIVNNSLVFSDAGASPAGLYICTGLQTIAATQVLLVGDSSSPVDFAFSPDAKTVYISDNASFTGTGNQSGGIQRWDTNAASSNYTFSYTLATGTGQTIGARGVTVDFSANANWGAGVTGAKIYATTADASGNRLIAITDTGASSATTTLATATANSALAGLRFGPVVLPITVAAKAQAVYAGNGATFTSVVTGNPPYFYQWQFNGNNLFDTGDITGSTTASLTVDAAQAALAGSYTLAVSNLNGSSVTSAPVTIKFIPVITATGNGAGASFIVNSTLGSGLPVFNFGGNSNVVELTQGSLNQQSATYYGYPLYVGGFLATWTYQVLNPGTNQVADGMAFVVQNDARGTATGPATGGGGGLGYQGITNSVALGFSIFSGSARHVGIALETNGVIATNTTPAPVSINSGDPINVTLLYANGLATVTLVDVVSNLSFITNVSIDIPGVVGASNAFVGFTAASGAIGGAQTISNFVFTSLVNITSFTNGDGTLSLTWPTNVPPYHVQSNSVVTSVGWGNLSLPIGVTNGVNQAVVPVNTATSAQFFRLVEP